MENLGTELSKLVGLKPLEGEEIGLRRALEPIMTLLELVNQRKTFKGRCLACP